MLFTLTSKLDTNSVNVEEISERLLMGPQEEVLTKIQEMNSYHQTDIHCTKTFRWQPGFYDKLQAKLIQGFGLNKKPKNVGKAYRDISNNEWMRRQFHRKITEIDAMLFSLRRQGSTFQDNTDIVKEKFDIWLKNINNSIEETDNISINIYLSNVLSDSRNATSGEHIVFVINVKNNFMSIGREDDFADINYGNVKIYIALPVLEVITTLVSGRDYRLQNRYKHYGSLLGGQYWGGFDGQLLHPYISSSSYRSNNNRTIDYANVIDNYDNNGFDQKDRFSTLCFGDLDKNIITSLVKGNLNISRFWLRKWATSYNTRHTGPLNNHARLYYGKPKSLYNHPQAESIFPMRDSESCRYNLSVDGVSPDLENSFCEIYECTMRINCTKYTTAYGINEVLVDQVNETNEALTVEQDEEVPNDSFEQELLLRYAAEGNVTPIQIIERD